MKAICPHCNWEFETEKLSPDEKANNAEFWSSWDSLLAAVLGSFVGLGYSAYMQWIGVESNYGGMLIASVLCVVILCIGIVWIQTSKPANGKKR